MTLKTLNVIRQVLAQEADKRRSAYKQARQVADRAEDHDAFLEAAADAAWREWDEVCTALRVFEDREW